MIGGLFIAMLLVLANAFFVAVEFAFIASRGTRLEQLAEEGDGRARAAVRSVHELGFMLSASQLGITMASLALGFVAEPTVTHLVRTPLEAVGLGRTAADTAGVVVALAIVVFVHSVLGEQVPKYVVLADPERAALVVARPMRTFANLFRPIVRSLTAIARAILAVVGVEMRDAVDTASTGAEIAELLAASRREGVLEETEHRLMSGALGFPASLAGEVMVPRQQVVAVRASAPAEAIERVVVESGHSRLPVYGRDLDDVLGFVHAKDLLDLGAGARRRPLSPRLVRQMLVVPADRTLQELLLAMQRARLHFAVVVDADRRTAGIVTLEDLLEELVGEITDEHD